MALLGTHHILHVSKIRVNIKLDDGTSFLEVGQIYVKICPFGGTGGIIRQVYVGTRVCVYVCRYVCIYVRMCVCVCVCIHIDKCTQTDTFTKCILQTKHAYIHVYIYTQNT